MRKFNHTENSHMDTVNKQVAETRYRRPWEPPTVKALKTVGELLQGGGGKLSTTGGDAGEPTRKPKGQG